LSRFILFYFYYYYYLKKKKKKKIKKVVICDFGLAKATNSANKVNTLKFRDIEGFSPRYTAPETFSNLRAMFTPEFEIESKGDVYSFAIILWEMMVGEPAWKDAKINDLEYIVGSGERV